ncbi:HNH endonuclease [Burkholderia sp. GS2Y]|uniref:HNH endonuclease n=1 Tax=Burkholderia theae TaxID=3143496 RepID=A0ABU9WR54_9BURK
MDERVARIVKNLSTWEELRQFEANAKRMGRLTDEMTIAIQVRATELGLALIAEKTGLQVTNLTPVQQKIVTVVSEYVGIMRQQGRHPGRTLEQLRNRGLIDAAEAAVCRATPTRGFEVLRDADLEDLSYEQIVMDHPDEFSPRALWFAKRTLGYPNTSETAPVEKYGDTQTRTATLLNWLKEQAAANSGYIPTFTNADAAHVMGMDDMQRFGQVHGNIQSRIDYACFLCNLPPLGCAADAPFSRAWGQQGRDWAFPVDQMQAAAHIRVWLPADFDQVLRETERLPGQAHLVWKEIFANDEAQIKTWALSFGEIAAPTRAVDAGVKRNPPWTRDELILALNLYLHHRASPPGKDSPEVAELSSILNDMGRVLGLGDADTYRNPNGVYMKMMNFRRFDPEYTNDGKVGLTRGNKDEEVVWEEFAGDPSRLATVCAAIKSVILEHATDAELSGAGEPDIAEADEGRILTRLHRVRERSRKLVEQAKVAALKKHGRLFCEACGFDFREKYGVAGEGLIDVHHTKPVHTLAEGDKTRLEDLALLCSNCHRVVHSSRRWLTVEQVSALVRQRDR